ncbi:hypothetical protein B0I37DRAFT_191104 [Chaetomium sp. MPI-CAGE-AT-0009]|nr:hypothetical protein B0I37DRAFT_191104 [Chaetomium sp. MPI-CAGE-AT-0009]
MPLLDILDFISSWATTSVKPWSFYSPRSHFLVKRSPPTPQQAHDVCIQDILKAKATSGRGTVFFYPRGNTSIPTGLSYQELHTCAYDYSRVLRSLPTFKEGRPILLHLDEHRDTILWFWAVLLANGVPVLSSPFSNVDEHRHRHTQGLSNLLESPICITTGRLLHLFDGPHSFDLRTIESLDQVASSHTHHATDSQPPRKWKGGQTLAILMLTSGSTGNAKAVRITHRQILAAIAGKASVRPLPPDKPFLNWIGLDHVASLVEMHIQALWLGVDQIHVHAADVVASPSTFLDLLSRHRVSRTFAPNFFLGRLVSTAPEPDEDGNGKAWDLSSLTVVASGGEANDVKTAAAGAALFERYGARRNVITPGFGMTETCAGAIYNMACPDYDLQRGDRAVTSVGKCMKGIEMRVVVGSRLAAAEEAGELEVRGDVVFDGYYRNEKATADAFPSPGGWFRTGDQACIDKGGNLCLIGRASEVVNINGVKVVAADLDSLLEQTLGHRVARFVVFPSRAAHTEQITICYVPPRWPHAAEDMAEIDDLAARVCIASASARPLVFSLRESSLPLLPTSTLGKISRAKMQSLFEAGVFGEDVTLHGQTLDAYMQQKQLGMSMESITEGEADLIADFAQTLSIDSRRIGPDTRVFELGFTSMDLIRLKHRIDTRLGITMPVITLMKNPTARSLANALGLNRSGGPSTADDQATAAAEYDPVVTFKPNGTKPPLWLVHPGVGEVLVFVGLAEHLADDDRPIYALRARGFEPGQTRFGSIAEAVDTYVEAVRRRQPRGPYALAGYSYGTMLAFEMAKRLDALEGGGSAVGFLGSFNLPPHIKSRMRQLSWNMCLLHLTQFLGLTTEAFVDGIHDEGDRGAYRGAARGEALALVLRAADGSRMAELGLEGQALARWADVAFGLQSMAADYDPDGKVDGIDVFHAVPLKVAAASREEWVAEHLSKWRDFARSEPRLHAVGGAHYTMIGPRHVVGFAVELKAALAARGM